MLVFCIRAEGPPEKKNRVTAGVFSRTLLLTGSLQAREAEHFVVPRTNTWQIQIKWMIKEGENVQSGQPVVRFDTSNLAMETENLEMALQDKEEEKLQKIADYNHQKFEVEVKVKQAEIDYKKKEIDASIPEGLETKYEYDKKQLDLKKSKQAFDNANMEKKVKLASLESDIKRIDIEIQEQREGLQKNRDLLKSLTLTAESSGTVVYAMHLWEGRKIQVGDNVPATWTVATIPNPESLEVEAWVNETHIQQLEPGQKVDVVLDAYPDMRFSGIVKDVLNSAEKRRQWGKTHYFSVSIQLDNRDLDIMKPGMSVKCKVHTMAHNDALLIPLEMALYNGSYFQVKPKGKPVVTITPLGFNYNYLALKKEEAGEMGIKEGTVLMPVTPGTPVKKEGSIDEK